MAEALYRKYRPQIFADVVGQEHIARTLRNAILQDKLTHAYLFTGPRGTGKTTMARLLAKALLCQNGPTPDPDGSCEDCQMIAAGEHPDVYELDAASRTGVENVREEIIGRVQFAPTRGAYKVYIIDEVHMLTVSAFNALLKTLEEPPSHVVFILATTDPQKVPETIHSRCQRFDFRRIAPESIVSRMGAICTAEDVEFEGEALELIAHRAEGGLRNALTSLEQLIAFGNGRVTMDAATRMMGSLDSSQMTEIVTAIGRRDAAACFRWVAEYMETGSDLAQFTRDLAERVRNLYVLSVAGEDMLAELPRTDREQLQREQTLFGPDRLARLLCVLGDLTGELKTSTNSRLSFEIALTRMIRPDSDYTMEALAERIEALEAGHSAVATYVPAAVPGNGLRDTAHSLGQSSLGETVQRTASVAAEHRSVDSIAKPGREADSLSQVQPAVTQKPRPAAESQLQPQHQFAPESDPVAESRPQPSPEPEAVPQRSSAAVAGLDLSNPAVLQRTWQSALAQLKRDKPPYAVLFLNAKTVFDSSKQMVNIEFSKSNNFAFKAVQKPEVTEAVSRCLQQVAGAAISFAYTQEGAAAPTATNVAAVSAASTASVSASSGAQQSAASESSSAAAVAAAAKARAMAAKQAAAKAQAAQQSAASQRPATQVSMPADDYDRPPVDVYDDYVPVDAYEDMGGYDQPVPSSVYEEPAPRVEHVELDPASEVSDPMPSSSDADDAGWQDALLGGFGGGVTFQQM